MGIIYSSDCYSGGYAWYVEANLPTGNNDNNTSAATLMALGGQN